MRRHVTVFLFLIAFLSFALPARAVDINPGDSCAGFAAGSYRPTGGPENPDGALVVCDGSIWQPILRYSSVGNAVMFASTGLAAAPLHVWGEAIIGNQGLACTPEAEGAIRYTGASPPWEYCDGSAWVNFKQPRCQDDDTGECYLDATRSNDDPEFLPQNIAAGVNILGVTGSFGALTQAGTISTADLDGAWGVAVAGDYAYVASYFADSLSVIDISDPANPAQVGTVSTADLDGATAVAGAGDYAYVASYFADSLSVIDISDRANPAQVGTVSTANLDGARGVAVAGKYAFVTSYLADSLSVIDISDPANPTQTGTISTADLNGAYAVAVAGDYAYVASYNADSLSVIDISDPANPTQTGTISTVDLDGARGVAVAGDYAYVASYNADSLSVIDISDPANPTQTGTISTADLDGARGVAVAGDYAYVASYFADSLSVIDISGPANPAQVGTVSTADLNGAWGVAVAGDYAYVASFSANSLSVIDLGGTWKAAEYFDCTADSTDTCVLDQNRSKYDQDFKPQNIADGVNILGVTGTLTGGLSGPAGCANIGDLCADGTVFAGWHPITYAHLFIPTVDQEQPGSPGTYTMNWKNATGTDDISTDSTNDGEINHANRGGAIGGFQAFQACEDLSFGGQTDWYLPSQIELYYIWAVHETIEAGGNITNFQNAFYWSSTEYSTVNAWLQYFTNGFQSNGNKTIAYRVRCVRR